MTTVNLTELTTKLKEIHPDITESIVQNYIDMIQSKRPIAYDIVSLTICEELGIELNGTK